MEDITFSYDGVQPVLQDIHFDIKEGEMVSLIGKNGAGKSTVSKLLCGERDHERLGNGPEKNADGEYQTDDAEGLVNR